QLAPLRVPVLIQGESGTGKELVATAVQRLSARSARPFERVNCADFTPELLRSELFGHERGAFSGAITKNVGLLSMGHGGTALLARLKDHHWPGNVRELEVVLEEVMIYQRGGWVRPEDLDLDLPQSEGPTERTAPGPVPSPRAIDDRFRVALRRQAALRVAGE